jgi:membrane protease YdiL (CAAX protease family)
MKGLARAGPIWQAVGWILVYIVVFNVGESISGSFGQSNSATAPLLMLLGIGLLLGLRARNRLAYYGLRAPRRTDFGSTLYFLPLLVMALLQFSKGMGHRFDAVDVLLIVAVMVAVGFLEELLFRGFLYQAVRAKGGVTRAVAVSGITFGLGHILNLARGYTGVEQVAQIIVAIAVGIVLALLVAVTGTIVPGVLFHILYNISGSLSAASMETEKYLAAVVVASCVLYSLFLVRRLRGRGQVVHAEAEVAQRA